MRISLLIFIFLFPGPGYSQTVIKNAETDPARYFDFWVGEWDLHWEAPDGTIEYGTNTIEKILDGKVILENFEATSGRFKGYKGKSFSVYHAKDKTWKQTWVDSEGAYLDFSGETGGEKRIFIRDGVGRDGKPVMQRMVFRDITINSLTWDWERSTDNGQTWQLQWRIEYQRAE